MSRQSILNILLAVVSLAGAAASLVAREYDTEEPWPRGLAVQSGRTSEAIVATRTAPAAE